jgi:hypothetical protein
MRFRDGVINVCRWRRTAAIPQWLALKLLVQRVVARPQLLQRHHFLNLSPARIEVLLQGRNLGNLVLAG